MANTLTLYRNVKITEDRNMIVENLAQYLSANEPGQQFNDWSYSDIQFLKDLNDLLEIKIRVKVTSMDETYNFHYAKIFNGNDTKYYFITAFKNIADDTCELSLKLDVLNTLHRKMIATEGQILLSVSKRTHITRQHKSRFSFISGTDVRAHIDEYSENINPKLYLKRKYTIYQKDLSTALNNKAICYLIYMKVESDIEARIVFSTLMYAYGFNDSPYDQRAHLITDEYQIPKNDSRILKIIALPYIPVSNLSVVYDGSNNAIKFPTPWESYFDNTWNLWCLRASGVSGSAGTQIYLVNEDLYDEIDTTNMGDMIYPSIFTNFSNGDFPKTMNDAKGALEDPKLLNSEFYYWKYIYDSFSKVVKLENELPDYRSLPTGHTASYSKLPLNFYMTSTINSRFMFEFKYLKELEFTDEDYSLFLIAQRNNEMTIFNDEYINYIRSGYNYDVKNKIRQEAYSWTTAGAGLISAGVGVATGNPLAILGGAMALSSAINNVVNSEMNMNKRLDQLKWQSASVYGADDVDLMTYYSGNKLWRAKYEVSDRMKSLLNELFFYTGYIEDKFSKEIFPNTRIWFDFIKADVVFESMNVAIPANQLEEFKKKYAEGVTIFHMQTINSVKTWNLEQNKENWEKEFFN